MGYIGRLVGLVAAPEVKGGWGLIGFMRLIICTRKCLYITFFERKLSTPSTLFFMLAFWVVHLPLVASVFNFYTLGKTPDNQEVLQLAKVGKPEFFVLL